MFYSLLARLRAIAFTLSILVLASHALEESLFTSSVTYCSPPETLLIQQFDVSYLTSNQSVSFNISAQSVEANVNVSANMLVNVYGLELVNITIDLCDILGGALCPLPMYDFKGADSISLPEQFSNRIPGIAFKIPDLEAFAQLKLVEVGTGNLKACVQATLSNGQSIHQPAVEWTTGGITLFTLLVAMWQSLSPTAVLPYRFLDLISLFQTIATSALLSLNYPVVYRAYGLNFAWALSLFSSRSGVMQQSINNMRALTGGGLANSTSGSAVAFVNRKLSPFNTGVTSGSGGISGLSTLASRGLAAGQHLYQRDEVQVVTSESSNVLQAGLPIYVNTIHISEANAFMTVFLCTLILIAIALFVFATVWVSLFAMRRFSIGREDTRARLTQAYPSWIRAWSLRLSIVMFIPIAVFAFYQWTLKDSWLSTLFSVITFLSVTAAIVYACVAIYRLVRRSEPSLLYSEPLFLGTFGHLYAQYRPARYYFFLLFVVGAFFKAIFISFVQVNGMAQVILILILELAMLGGVLVLRPHKTRGADVFSSFLAIVRVVCTGLMIAFAESIGVAAIPRVAIGIVIAVIYSVTILVVIFNLILRSGIRRLWKRREVVPSSPRGSSNNMLEKGDISPIDDSSEYAFGRPRNPTPERNVPLDPEVNQPYSPTSPSTTIDYASTRQRDSESTNFGSVLPRRWSFTPLHTPTDSSALDHSPPFDSTLPRTSEEPSSYFHS